MSHIIDNEKCTYYVYRKSSLRIHICESRKRKEALLCYHKAKREGPKTYHIALIVKS